MVLANIYTHSFIPVHHAQSLGLFLASRRPSAWIVDGFFFFGGGLGGSHFTVCMFSVARLLNQLLLGIESLRGGCWSENLVCFLEYRTLVAQGRGMSCTGMIGRKRRTRERRAGGGLKAMLWVSRQDCWGIGSPATITIENRVYPACWMVFLGRLGSGHLFGIPWEHPKVDASNPSPHLPRELSVSHIPSGTSATPKSLHHKSIFWLIHQLPNRKGCHSSWSSN